MSLSLIISNHENDVKKKAVNNTKTRKNLHTNGGIFKTNDELCPLSQGETRLIRYKNSDKTSDSFEFLSSSLSYIAVNIMDNFH